MNRLASVLLLGAVLAPATALAQGKPTKKANRFVKLDARRDPVEPTLEPEKWLVSAKPGFSVYRVALRSKVSKLVTRVAIVADGYTSSTAFRNEAMAVIDEIRSKPAGQTLTLFQSFEFYLIYTPSEEAASIKRKARTYFGSFRSAKGSITVVTRGIKDLDAAKDEATRRVDAVALAAGKAIPGGKPDVTVLLVHFSDEEGPYVFKEQYPRSNADFPENGGRVRQFGNDPLPFVHEFGHALYGLGDEYAIDDPTGKLEDGVFAANYSRCFNITDEKGSKRWRYFTADEPKEGGARVGKGVWHPYANCVMNDRNNPANNTYCTACFYAMEAQSTFRMSPGTLAYGYTALLDPPSLAAKKTGQEVLLYTKFDVPNGEILGTIHGKANVPLTLGFCNGGMIPKSVKLRLVGPKDQSIPLPELTGADARLSQIVVPGLAALPDLVDAKGKKTKRCYVILQSVDGSAEGYAGAIYVPN